MLWEPVNVDFVCAFVRRNYEALQEIDVVGVPATTMLFSFVLRANVKGMVKTLGTECRGKSPYEARDYSGLSTAEGRIPDELLVILTESFADEPVPMALRGISAFMLPKELKCILRFGCDVTDFDQVCCHPTILLDRVSKAPNEFAPGPRLKEYVSNPKAFREAVACDKRVLFKRRRGASRMPPSCD